MSWDLQQTADHIGVAPETLRKNRREWARRRGFPAALGVTRRLAWDEAAVRAWISRRAGVLGGDGRLDLAGDGFPAANDRGRADRHAIRGGVIDAARVNRDRQAARLAMQRGR